MFCLEHGLDSVKQGLDDLLLLNHESRTWTDVDNASFSSLSVFTAGSSDGKSVFLSNFLSLWDIFAILGQFWKGNVNTEPHSSSQIAWTTCDGSESFIIHQIDSRRLNGINELLKTIQSHSQIASLIHKHDSQVIFLSNPHEEPLVFWLIQSSSLGPVVRNTSWVQIGVSRHILEHLVVFNQFFILFIGNFVWMTRSDWPVLTSKFRIAQ